MKYDLGKIRFIQEFEDSRVLHEIRGDASIDEVMETFEAFLKGAGYHLVDGQHIGYEYEEYDTFNQNIGNDQPSLDPTKSHYFYDTERNR